MKKVLLLSAALLALSASAAFAQGFINLSYSDCGANGLSNLNNACTSNSGAATLVSSAAPPVAMGQWVGSELVLDIQVEGGVLPAWWQYDVGGCRAGKMIASFDFTTGPFSCSDAFQGQGFGGLAYFPGFGGADRARIKTAAAVAPPGFALNAGEEYYMAKTTILFSTNSTTCAGCSTPACIVLNSVKLAQPAGVGDYTVITPGNSQHVTWQGGGTLNCPAATPTQSNSWGEIKAMYR